jgi:hypothetical protein
MKCRGTLKEKHCHIPENGDGTPSSRVLVSFSDCAAVAPTNFLTFHIDNWEALCTVVLRSFEFDPVSLLLAVRPSNGLTVAIIKPPSRAFFEEDSA